MTGVIVSPKLLAALAGTHYPASCTIQQNTPTQDSLNQQVDNWANLAGHVGLPCAVSDAGSGEHRGIWGSYPEAQKLIALAGHYPSITSLHAVMVGGNRYDILAVVHDSQSATTYLPVRRVIR